jgi:hypothetical protein
MGRSLVRRYLRQQLPATGPAAAAPCAGHPCASAVVRARGPGLPSCNAASLCTICMETMLQLEAPHADGSQLPNSALSRALARARHARGGGKQQQQLQQLEQQRAPPGLSSPHLSAAGWRATRAAPAGAARRRGARGRWCRTPTAAGGLRRVAEGRTLVCVWEVAGAGEGKEKGGQLWAPLLGGVMQKAEDWGLGSAAWAAAGQRTQGPGNQPQPTARRRSTCRAAKAFRRQRQAAHLRR